MYKVLTPNFHIKTYDQLLTLVCLLYYLVFTLFLTYPPLKLYFNWLTIKVAPSLNGLILFQSWLSLNPRLETLNWYNSNWALFWGFCNIHQAAFSITSWEFHSLHLNKMEYLMNLTFDLLYPIVPLLALDLTRFLPFDPPLIMPIIPTRNPSIPSILQLSIYQLSQLVLISITSGIIWIIWSSFIKFQYRSLIWLNYMEEGYLIFKTQGKYKLAKVN